MKIFKSHFWYNKSQRNGVFLLALIIIILQISIYSEFYKIEQNIKVNNPEILAFQHQIDSLKLVEIENRKPRIYPFNPNFITDFMGEQLGMSTKEIDRLLAFRKTNEFVNSKQEFQDITKVSDSLLHKISPFFKFPEWVVTQERKKNAATHFRPAKRNAKLVSSKYKISTTNINKATAEDLKTINGIGTAFSSRIIKYRSKLQGFSYNSQLYEVWGLEKEVADKVLNVFKIYDVPIIKKVNVNTVEFKELLKNPYIDYELCKKIFNYRDEVAELQNISELKNIKGFPLDLYDRIVLYLLAE